MVKQQKIQTAAEEKDELCQEFGDQLSLASGVSRAMLSKVERGEKSPTIGVATRISRALNTSLSFLTGGEEQRRAFAIVRKQQRHIFRDDQNGFERHMLSPPIAGSAVELLLHVLPAGASTGKLPAYPRGTEKYVVVEKGELVVVLPNQEARLLQGDALFFEADVEHAFINRSKSSCRYYLVISRHDRSQ
jgi:transcriptional regulator with XRE-family HTH domain